MPLNASAGARGLDFAALGSTRSVAVAGGGAGVVETEETEGGAAAIGDDAAIFSVGGAFSGANFSVSDGRSEGRAATALAAAAAGARDALAIAGAGRRLGRSPRVFAAGLVTPLAAGRAGKELGLTELFWGGRGAAETRGAAGVGSGRALRGGLGTEVLAGGGVGRTEVDGRAGARDEAERRSSGMGAASSPSVAAVDGWTRAEGACGRADTEGRAGGVGKRRSPGLRGAAAGGAGLCAGVAD